MMSSADSVSVFALKRAAAACARAALACAASQFSEADRERLALGLLATAQLITRVKGVQFEHVTRLSHVATTMRTPRKRRRRRTA